MPIQTDAQIKDFKALRTRQEDFETVVKTEFKGIKDLLEKALARAPKMNYSI